MIPGVSTIYAGNDLISTVYAGYDIVYKNDDIIRRIIAKYPKIQQYISAYPYLMTRINIWPNLLFSLADDDRFVPTMGRPVEHRHTESAMLRLPDVNGFADYESIIFMNNLEIDKFDYFYGSYSDDSTVDSTLTYITVGKLYGTPSNGNILYTFTTNGKYMLKLKKTIVSGSSTNGQIKTEAWINGTDYAYNQGSYEYGKKNKWYLFGITKWSQSDTQYALFAQNPSTYTGKTMVGNLELVPYNGGFLDVRTDNIYRLYNRTDLDFHLIDSTTYDEILNPDVSLLLTE